MNIKLLSSLTLCFALIYGTISEVPTDILPQTILTRREDTANKYFVKYGYIPEQNMGHAASQTVIQRFQKMAGLKQTGILDENTMNMMKFARCGVPDVIQDENRKKRYVLFSDKWDYTDLTFRIESYSSRLSRETLDATVAEALNYWAKVSPLTFTKLDSGTPDISIIFSTYDHGDDSPFDGVSGVLAHAFFPFSASNPLSGDAHFDEDEPWTVKSYYGQNLLQVATHEFGHSLGLSHSDDDDAIMFAFAKSYDPNLKLGEDDIQGIQALYGTNRTTTPTVRTTTKTATSWWRATSPRGKYSSKNLKS